MKITKELLLSSDITYDVSPSGSGAIMMEVQEGLIVVTEFENRFDELYVDDQYLLTYNCEGWNWKTPLDKTSREVISDFILENNLTKQYMDEVYEAVNQTF